MFQNKYILFVFLAMLIDGEVRGQNGIFSTCKTNWEKTESEGEVGSELAIIFDFFGGPPQTPPINTVFSVNQDIGTYIKVLGSSTSLTSQISTGIYNAAVTGVAAVPVVGPILSAIGSFFSFLFGGGGEEEINLTPLFQQFANYMDQYVAETDYQNEITNLIGFYKGAQSQIEEMNGLNINQQFTALQIATNDLANALYIYEDNEDIKKYAYYSFDFLYLNALLHTNTAAGLVAVQAQIEPSDCNDLYQDVVQLCATYTNLLSIYQSQACNWRDEEISEPYYSNKEEEGYYSEGSFEPVMCWKDSVQNEDYCISETYFDEEKSDFDSCIHQMADWSESYSNNVNLATDEYFSGYVSNYQTICSSFTLQDIDVENLDDELELIDKY